MGAKYNRSCTYGNDHVAPAPRLSPSARRAQVLDAAARAFASAGYAGTSITAIAVAAGVTPRILYRHFAVEGRAVPRRCSNAWLPGSTESFAEPTGRYGVDVAELLAVGPRRRRRLPGAVAPRRREEPEFRAVADRCRSGRGGVRPSRTRRVDPATMRSNGPRPRWSGTSSRRPDWIEFGRPADDARFVRAPPGLRWPLACEPGPPTRTASERSNEESSHGAYR